MYAFAAFATLTKGLIGFVLPGFVIFMWILCLNEWRSLKSYYLVRGTLLFLLIAAPWHILMQIKHPEFFHYYFVEQHLLRYLTDYADRSQPAWFLTVAVLIGFFPWCWFLITAPFSCTKGCFSKTTIASLWQKRKMHKETIFVILWPLLIFLFFNASDSLLLSYALPIMPPLAVLTAYYLNLFWKKGYITALNVAFIGIFVTGLGGSIAALSMVEPLETSVRSSNYWYASMGLLGIGMLFTLFFYCKKGLKAGLITLFTATSLTLISINLSYDTLDNRPIKSLALQLKPLLAPDTLVIAYREYYQDLPVYLNRTVQLVDYRGELDFGIDHQIGQSIIWNEATAWKHWQGNARVFMIMSLEDYKRLKNQPNSPTMCPLGQTSKDILLINRHCSL
jgi:4-amino-4-deoxy-L-arabinose transferase-like glycosyltransferase